MEFESADLEEASYFSYPSSSSSSAAHSPPYRRGIPRLVVSLAPSLSISRLSPCSSSLSLLPPSPLSLLSLFLSLIHGDPQE